MARPEGVVLRPQDLGIGKLFETVRDAVIVADASTGRIVLWNPAASEIFGYSSSEALEGLNVEALVPERLKERHRAGLSRTTTPATDPTSTPTQCWTCPPCARGARRYGWS